MKRIISFSDFKDSINLGASTGEETFNGVLTLPLEKTYLISRVLCHVKVLTGVGFTFGYLSYRSADYSYTDSVNGETVSRGSFDGLFSLTPGNNSSFEMYNQNEISGSGYDNFSASNEAIFEINQENRPYLLFSGKKLNTKMVFDLRMPDSANTADVQTLLRCEYNVNIELEEISVGANMPEGNPGSFATKIERFGFDPAGSSLGWRE